MNKFFHDSIRGNYILLSATPSQEDINDINKDNGEVITLFERYHHQPLPKPVFYKRAIYSSYLTIIQKLKQYIKEDKRVFIFAPTIESGKKLFSILNLFISKGAFVSSKEEERRLDIEKFKNGELLYLVTTSILERGVTVN